uniref:Uncharacterized protein n=1 Tax=viral metagenome TaxID=1070528 RepID=A0A6C0CB88_9ZZZZ
MLALYDDAIIKISEKLRDKEKIYLSMTSKQLDDMKFKMIYTEFVSISTIRLLPYFDNFENIDMCSCDIYRYPKSVKYIYLSTDRSDIPSSVTHLMFGYSFDQSIRDCIPSSVTHLSFSFYFDQPIKIRIPSSVTHLRFGYCFNHSIKDIIPSSVTHLLLGATFNQSIKGSISSSITHLTFDAGFNKSIEDYIPSSVTHLTFRFGFYQPIKGIARSIKKIVLHNGYNLDIDKDILSHAVVEKY